MFAGFLKAIAVYRYFCIDPYTVYIAIHVHMSSIMYTFESWNKNQLVIFLLKKKVVSAGALGHKPENRL